MKVYKRVASAIAVFIVALFMVIPMIQAQQEDNLMQKTNHASPQAGRARTIQKSNMVITLKFTFDNGEQILAYQHDGAMIRIRRGNRTLGFTPYLPEGADGPVALRMFQIKQIVKSGRFVGEGMIEQKTYDFSKELVNYKIDDLSSSIELVEVSNGLSASKRDITIQDYGVFGDNECCVNCGGIEACACAVVSNCGRCCVGQCC